MYQAYWHRVTSITRSTFNVALEGMHRKLKDVNAEPGPFGQLASREMIVADPKSLAFDPCHSLY